MCTPCSRRRASQGFSTSARSAPPNAVWLSVTPFGLTRPRASWRASDLGVLASSGNMYSTGNPDRPPVRCTEPSGYAHTGGEAAFAVLTALWTGHPHHIDLSMQECVRVANMAQAATFERRIRREASRTIQPANAGDLAGVGRLRVVRLARRQSQDPFARAHRQARRGGWARRVASRRVGSSCSVEIADRSAGYFRAREPSAQTASAQWCTPDRRHGRSLVVV